MKEQMNEHVRVLQENGAKTITHLFIGFAIQFRHCYVSHSDIDDD